MNFPHFLLMNLIFILILIQGNTYILDFTVFLKLNKRGFPEVISEIDSNRDLVFSKQFFRPLMLIFLAVVVFLGMYGFVVSAGNLIYIDEASLHDSEGKYVEDVYDLVSEKDNLFLNVPAGSRVKVMFERLLTSENDITIYARSSGGSVTAFETGGGEVADFGEISEYGKYRVLLEKLKGGQDNFDLHVSGKPVEFDFIVDPPANDSQVVYRCGDIISPAYYTINQSFSGAGTCLNITSGNVTLEGNASSINGTDGDDGGYGILVWRTGYGLKNVSILNLSITNFSKAVHFRHVNDSTVGNVTFRNNGDGWFLNDSHSNTGYGIDVSMNKSNSGSNGTGIWFSMNSSKNKIYDSWAYNLTRGIYLSDESSANEFINVTVANNTVGDILDYTGNSYLNYWIYTNYFGTIRWIDSTDGGFLKDLSTKGNVTFPGSVSITNSTARFDLGTISTGNFNSTINITFTNGSLAGTYNSFNWKNIRIVYDLNRTCDTGTEPHCVNYTLVNESLVKFNATSWGKYGIFSINESPEVKECIVLNKTGQQYRQVSELSVDNKHCVRIGEDHISFDGAGYSVTGNFLNSTSGIFVGQTGYGLSLTNITVKNATVNKFGRGVNFRKNNHSRILTSIMYNIHFGIYLNNSENGTMKGNEIYNHTVNQTYSVAQFGYGTAAIMVWKSSNNTIEGNNIHDDLNFSNGIMLFENSSHNTLINNNISNNSLYEILDGTANNNINFLIYNNSFGKVEWTDTNDNGFVKNLSVEGDLIFSENESDRGNITIFNSTIEINVSIFDLAKSAINSSANVTFYDQPTRTDPEMRFFGANTCDLTTQPECRNFTSLNSDLAKFNVSNWKMNFTIFGAAAADPDTTFPLINFTSPTQPNETSTTNTSIIVNVSITESNLSELTYNWNNTNFTLYNNSLQLMFNFNNYTGVNNTGSLGGNGSLNGNPIFNSSGKYEGSYNVDGNDFISIDTLALTALTVSAWVKFDTDANDVIFGGVGSTTYAMYIHPTFMYFSVGSAANVAHGGVPTGEWIHFVITRDPSNTITFYKDGRNLGTGSKSGTFNLGSIGAYPSGASGMDGQIDEAMVWNRALSEAEVTQLYMTDFHKYGANDWVLYVNQSQNATDGLPVGGYDYYTYAKDGANNVNRTELRNITIESSADTTVPLLAIDNPLAANYTTGLIDFNITLNEEGDQGWFTLDGGAVNYTMSAENTTVFNYTNTSVTDGTYTATFYANDTSGNLNDTESVTFSVDTVVPGVAIDHPNDLNYTTERIEFNVTVSETGNLSWFTLDGGKNNFTMTRSNNTVFNFTNSSIPDGTYTAQFYVNDTSGNVNVTENFTFSIDTVVPGVAIDSPTAQNYTTNRIEFNVTVSETGNLSWFTLDGGAVNYTMTRHNNTVFNYTNTSMTEGSYTATFYVNDTSGNVNGTESVAFVYDITPPVVNLHTRVNGTIVTDNATQFFNASFSDNVALINSTLFIWNTTHDVINSTEFDLIPLAVNQINQSATLPREGIYLWNYLVSDAAANVAFNVTNWTITLARAPNVTLLTENTTDPASYNKTFRYEFNTTVLDDTSVSVVRLEFNGTNYTAEKQGNVYNVSVFNLAAVDIAYGYTWYANDTFGNSNGTQSGTYTVSRAASVLNLTLNGSESNVTISNGQTIDFNATILTGEQGATVEMYQDGTLINTGLGDRGNITTVSSSGIINITAIYRQSENYSLSAVTWYVNATVVPDTTAPNVDLLLPGNASTITTATLSFNVSFNDNKGLSNATFYLWNNTHGIVNSTNVTITGLNNATNLSITLPEEGTFNWGYFVYDNSTNSAWNVTNFTVTYAIPAAESTPAATTTGGSGGARIIYPNENSIGDTLKIFDGATGDFKLAYGDGEPTKAHTITVNSIEKDLESGEFIVHGTVNPGSFEFEMREGESVKYDFDGDGEYDLELTVRDAEQFYAQFYLDGISEPALSPGDDKEVEIVEEEKEPEELGGEKVNVSKGILIFLLILVGLAILIVVVILVRSAQNRKIKKMLSGLEGM